MIQQNELITLLVGTGAMLFVLFNRHRISRIPGSRWLLFSFLALYAGWALTVLEGFVMPQLLNILEHACYMVSSMASAVWCWFHVFKGDVRN